MLLVEGRLCWWRGAQSNRSRCCVGSNMAAFGGVCVASFAEPCHCLRDATFVGDGDAVGLMDAMQVLSVMPAIDTGDYRGIYADPFCLIWIRRCSLQTQVEALCRALGSGACPSVALWRRGEARLRRLRRRVWGEDKECLSACGEVFDVIRQRRDRQRRRRMFW